MSNDGNKRDGIAGKIGGKSFQEAINDVLSSKFGATPQEDPETCQCRKCRMKRGEKLEFFRPGRESLITASMRNIDEAAPPLLFGNKKSDTQERIMWAQGVLYMLISEVCMSAAIDWSPSKLEDLADVVTQWCAENLPAQTMLLHEERLRLAPDKSPLV